MSMDEDGTGWGDSEIREMPRAARFSPAEVHVIDGNARLGVPDCDVEGEHVHISIGPTYYEVEVVNVWGGSELSTLAVHGVALVSRVPIRPNWWQRLVGETLDNAVSLGVKWARGARRERLSMYTAREVAEARYGVRRRSR